MLDVGCGTGRLLDFIDPYDYVGIDPSRKMLRKAIERSDEQVDWARLCWPGRRFIEAPGEHAREILRRRHYDLACAFWSLSYVDNPLEVLEGMHLALRPGGCAIVHAMTERYTRRASHILEPSAIATYSAPLLELAMYDAGFETVELLPFRVLPDFLVETLPQRAAERWLRWEMRLPASLGMTIVAIGRP